MNTARFGSHVLSVAMVMLVACVSAPERTGENGPLRPDFRIPRVEEVTVRSGTDNVDLLGDLYLPCRVSPAPAVLLLGPTGPDDRNLSFGRLEPFRALGEHLQAHGMAVLTLDDRGVGGSGGDWRLADHATLADDASSALEWLAGHPAVDSARVGMLGLSEGSAVALMAAARRPERVGFLILGSPPGLPGEEALEHQLERTLATSGIEEREAEAIRQTFKRFVVLSRRASVDTSSLADFEAFLAGPGAGLIPPYRFVPAGADGRARLLSSPWYRSQLDWDPRALLSEVRAPTLVIGGELDPILPPALHHPPLAAGLDRADVRFEVIAGVNHLLLPSATGAVAEYRDVHGSADPRVLELITGWLGSQGLLPDPRSGSRHEQGESLDQPRV